MTTGDWWSMLTCMEPTTTEHQRLTASVQPTDPVEPPITVTIEIVPDSPCPDCGAAWGHPDPALDFPNRPKSGDDEGNWWWRCYNPACPTDYYLPLL